MSDDDIRRLAEEAELTYTDTFRGEVGAFAAWKENNDLTSYLRRFALAVKAATVGLCASACDDVASECSNWDEGSEDARVAAELCAFRVKSCAAGDAALDSWRPIASAPRDGTVVLGYDEGVAPMQFNARTERWEIEFGTLWADGSSLCTPTHWQPLPAKPAKSGR